MGDYNYLLKMINITKDVFKTKEKVMVGLNGDYQEVNWILFNRKR